MIYIFKTLILHMYKEVKQLPETLNKQTGMSLQGQNNLECFPNTVHTYLSRALTEHSDSNVFLW